MLKSRDFVTQHICGSSYMAAKHLAVVPPYLQSLSPWFYLLACVGVLSKGHASLAGIVGETTFNWYMYGICISSVGKICSLIALYGETNCNGPGEIIICRNTGLSLRLRRQSRPMAGVYMHRVMHHNNNILFIQLTWLATNTLAALILVCETLLKIITLIATALET